MQSSRPICHLAFPIKNVPETVKFYRDFLGLPVDLIESNRCIIRFFDHQMVAHVSEKDVPQEVSMYPRHFGVIFDEEDEYEEFLGKAKKSGAPFFQESFLRFPQTEREHKSFFLKDPSNNLLEFKWYRNAHLIYKPTSHE